MGSSRLNQLNLARRGIPWLGIGVVTTPAATLMTCAFVFERSAVAWSLLRLGVLLWAVAVAFVLDERSAPVTAASPRSPTWWFWGRFLGGTPLLIPPIVAGFIWAVDRPEVDPIGFAIQAIAAWLIVFAGAALASRLGRNTPGDLVAGTAVLIALFLLTFPVGIHGVPLLPVPGDPRWDQSTVLWSGMGMAAVLTIAVAGWWWPNPKPATSIGR